MHAWPCPAPRPADWTLPAGFNIELYTPSQVFGARAMAVSGNSHVNGPIITYVGSYGGNLNVRTGAAAPAPPGSGMLRARLAGFACTPASSLRYSRCGSVRGQEARLQQVYCRLLSWLLSSTTAGACRSRHWSTERAGGRPTMLT